MATETNLSSERSGIAERIKEDGKNKLETSKRSAADQIDQVAQALNRAGQELNSSQPTLANYAAQVAGTVGNFAARLRDGNMDELIDETRALARRNPGLFLVGGVAAGFFLSRFLKASGSDVGAEESGDYSSMQTGDYETSDYTQGPGYVGTQEFGDYAGTSAVRSREEYSSPGSRTNGG